MESVQKLLLEIAEYKLQVKLIILDTRNTIEFERARRLGFICEGVGRKLFG